MLKVVVCQQVGTVGGIVAISWLICLLRPVASSLKYWGA